MRTSSTHYPGRSPRFLLILALVLPPTGCHDPAANSLDEASLAIEQRHYDQTLAAADRYLQQKPLGPNAAQALYLRGRAIEQRPKPDHTHADKDLRQAKIHYLKALEQSPSKTLQAYVHTSLGNVSYWLGDFANAAAYWKEAYHQLEHDPLRASVLYRIGVCQQRLGNWTDADATLRRVQREFPGTDPAQQAQKRQTHHAFYVQIATFANAASAQKLAQELRSQGFSVTVQDRSQPKLSVVLSGPAQTYAHAQAIRNRLISRFPDALILP